jgi:hypothetical protein
VCCAHTCIIECKWQEAEDRQAGSRQEAGRKKEAGKKEARRKKTTLGWVVNSRRQAENGQREESSAAMHAGITSGYIVTCIPPPLRCPAGDKL